MKDYSSLLILILVSVLIGLVIELLSYSLGRIDSEREKLSGFECGFEMFESSRDKFDIKFYLVGMLFIIFDIEASYLFPWAMVVEGIGDIGMLGMVDFILELVIGMIYIYRSEVIGGV